MSPCAGDRPRATRRWGWGQAGGAAPSGAPHSRCPTSNPAPPTLEWLKIPKPGAGRGRQLRGGERRLCRASRSPSAFGEENPGRAGSQEMSPAGHGSEPVTAAASETAPANPRDPRSHPNHPAPPAGFGTKTCPATSGVPVVGTPQVSPRHTGDPSLRPPCPHGAGDGSDAAPLPRRHAAGGFPAHLHRVHADLAALPGPAAPVSFCCGNWGKLGSIPRWGRAQPRPCHLRGSPKSPFRALGRIPISPG